MESGSSYRREEIKKIQRTLQENQAHHSATAGKFKACHLWLQTMCALSGALATIFSASGLASAFSEAGLAVGGPLIGMSTACSLVSTFCSVAGKFLQQKATKHNKLQLMAEQTLREVSSLVSAALTKAEISDAEYQEINKRYWSFASKLGKIRFQTDGPPAHQS